MITKKLNRTSNTPLLGEPAPSLSKWVGGGLIKYFTKSTHIAPLAVFRIIFGAMMFAGTLRFILKGWVYELYVAPKFYFTYSGFEWVKPLGEYGMYAAFFTLAILSLFIMLGFFYRASSVLFFLLFTYIELIDKTNYLNHYYFITLVAFLMMLVPAHRYFSLDVFRKPMLKITHVPRWVIDMFKLQLAIVYICAGIAKLNYDWLFRAMPLQIWLPAHSDFPIIGSLFTEKWVAYFFSWFGALYDLSIPFLMLFARTRFVAYLLVIVFHGLTAMLFPIGMFPYIMILATLIFFPVSFHNKIIEALSGFLNRLIRNPSAFATATAPATSSFFVPASAPSFYPSLALPEGEGTATATVPAASRLITVVLISFFALQLLLPFRYLLYPGKLFWTEEGYRFSWRVMLMEKAGTSFFYVADSKTGKQSEVSNCDYLTKNQEKMMATQPDMIIQYAQFLKEDFKQKGIYNPRIYADCYVTLNGSGSRPFINPSVDLSKPKLSSGDIVLPFEQGLFLEK